MAAATSADLEREAYRQVNAWLEPLIRTGLGAPVLTPLGAIVLEVTGRKSGHVHAVPLLAWAMPGATVISTFRGHRSQWVRNLHADPRCAWFVGRVRKQGVATVFAPGAWPDSPVLPALLERCLPAWRALVDSGWAVVVLRESPP